MYQNPGAFDVLEEIVPQPNAFTGTFDQSRNVGHDERVVQVDCNLPQVGILGGKRIVCDFGTGAGEATEQSAFASVGFSNNADVSDHFQFEP